MGPRTGPPKGARDIYHIHQHESVPAEGRSSRTTRVSHETTFEGDRPRPRRARHAPRRTIVLAATCSSLVLPTALSNATVATAATAPTGYASATPRPFMCDHANGRRLVVALPQMTSVSDRLETVYYSPDLYRWGGPTVGWYLVNGSKPWFKAAANKFCVHVNPTFGATLTHAWFTLTGFTLTQLAYNCPWPIRVTTRSGTSSARQTVDPALRRKYRRVKASSVSYASWIGSKRTV